MSDVAWSYGGAEHKHISRKRWLFAETENKIHGSGLTKWRLKIQIPYNIVNISIRYSIRLLANNYYSRSSNDTQPNVIRFIEFWILSFVAAKKTTGTVCQWRLATRSEFIDLFRSNSK